MVWSSNMPGSEEFKHYRVILWRLHLTMVLSQLAGCLLIAACGAGLVYLVSLVFGPFRMIVYATCALASAVLYLCCAGLSFPQSYRMSRGFASLECGQRMLSQGHRASAAAFFRRAIDELCQDPSPLVFEGRLIPAQEALLQCVECLEDQPLLLRQLHAQLTPGRTAPQVALLLWHWSALLEVGGGWTHLETYLWHFLRAFPHPPRDAQLAITIARMGETAASHEATELARALLAWSAKGMPHVDENSILIQTHLAALSLAKGNLAQAAQHGQQALLWERTVGRPAELTLFGSSRADEAWRQIELRVLRPLPCHPVAYLLAVLGSLYRSAGTFELAWQCSLNALVTFLDHMSFFPQCKTCVDHVLAEIGLLAWQTGWLSKHVVPSEMLVAPLVHNPMARSRKPVPVLEFEQLGLMFVRGFYPHRDQLVRLLDQYYAGMEDSRRVETSWCYYYMEDIGIAAGRFNGLAQSIAAASDPWCLSEWGLVAQRLGFTDLAEALHARALRARGAGSDQSFTWIVLRYVQFLLDDDRAEEALSLGLPWLDRTRTQGWKREEYACLDMLQGLGAHSGSRLPQRLDNESEYSLAWLYAIFKEGLTAYQSEDFAAARDALENYVTRCLRLQAQVDPARLGIAVAPARLAEAFGMLVDCFSRDAGGAREAVEWCERSKLWIIERGDWNPVVLPVDARWDYPFGTAA